MTEILESWRSRLDDMIEFFTSDRRKNMAFTRADLQELDRLYQGAKKEGLVMEANRLPEGRYQAKIKKAELTTLASGQVKAHFIYQITGGDEKLVGAIAESWEGLKDTQNMGYFAKKMNRLGLPFDSFPEVPALIKRAVGAVVEIQAKDSKDGEFTNIYVNKLIKAATGEAEADADDTSYGTPDSDAADTVADTDADADADATADSDAAGAETEDAADAEEAAPSPRDLPTQEELDAMKPAGIDKVLASFKLNTKKLDEKARRSVAKVFVCAVENDDAEGFNLKSINGALNAAGLDTVLKPKAGWAALVGYIANLE